MVEKERKISPAVLVIPFALGLAALGVFAALAMAAPPTPPPGRANLYGRVTDDETGQPIIDVTLSLDSIQTQTDNQGQFLFDDLEPGSYVLTLIKEGYERTTYDVTLQEGPNELNVQMVPVTVAQFVYVSPLTADRDNWHIEAWVDIQNQGATAAECTVSFYMREYHAGYDMWLAWGGPWGVTTARLEPEEVRRFSWLTECSAPLEQQVMVKSPATKLLQPPSPKEYLCAYCWEESHLSFDTLEELNAHIASAHP